MGCEDLERVDIIVGARLGLSKVEAHFALSEIEVVEVEVVRLLV